MPGISLSIPSSQGDAERKFVQISDDGDHVGTVQYSLTESSCFDASNLSKVMKL
jgi:hypothetical protein